MERSRILKYKFQYINELAKNAQSRGKIKKEGKKIFLRKPGGKVVRIANYSTSLPPIFTSDNQHGIAVTEETVFLFNRFLIGFFDKLKRTKGRYHHDQGRGRQVKVG